MFGNDKKYSELRNGNKKMDTTIINEPIVVGAVFSKNTVNPKWFIRENDKHTISEVTYTWETNLGNAKIINFAVTNGSTVFEISFNKKTLEWKLEKTVIE